MRYILILLALFVAGCNNLSPRDNLSPELKQQLENSNSKINGIENNQNSIKSELGRLSNDLTIHDSQIKEMQEGYFNLRATLSQNENSGIQVLQGDGALVLVFAVATVGMLLYYFYCSLQYQRTARVLAKQIADYQDPELHNRVLQAASVADVEKTLYHLAKNL